MKPRKPPESVIGIVLSPNKKEVLLIKRRDVPVWAFPGGGVEFGETPSEAVIREIYEEGGIKAEIIRQTALYTPINKLANTTHVFECKMVNGNLSTGNETAEVGFFPFENLPTPFFFLHREWLEDARQQHPKMIMKSISQVTYLNLFKYIMRHPILVARLILSRIGLPINSRT